MTKYTNSEIRYDEYDSVDRMALSNYTHQLMNEEIEVDHIISIISILFEEMTKDLLEEKEINIGGFGLLKLIKVTPRRIWNVYSKQHQITEETINFRFYLAKKLKKLLLKCLALEKILDDNYDE